MLIAFNRNAAICTCNCFALSMLYNQQILIFLAEIFSKCPIIYTLIMFIKQTEYTYLPIKDWRLKCMKITINMRYVAYKAEAS